MTKQAYLECLKIKKEMEKLEDSLKVLPKYKEQYTKLEYNVRKEYYKAGLDNWKEEYDAQYKKLSWFEKMKLVFK